MLPDHVTGFDGAAKSYALEDWHNIAPEQYVEDAGELINHVVPAISPTANLSELQVERVTFDEPLAEEITR